MKDLKVDDRLVTAKTIQSRISHAKNHGKTPQNLLDDSWDPSWEYTANVFNEYEKRLQKSNALDFDDLLIKTVDVVRQVSARSRKNTALVSSTSWSTNTRTRIASSIGSSAI